MIFGSKMKNICSKNMKLVLNCSKLKALHSICTLTMCFQRVGNYDKKKIFKNGKNGHFLDFLKIFGHQIFYNKVENY